MGASRHVAARDERAEGLRGRGGAGGGCHRALAGTGWHWLALAALRWLRPLHTAAAQREEISALDRAEAEAAPRQGPLPEAQAATGAPARGPGRACILSSGCGPRPPPRPACDVTVSETYRTIGAAGHAYTSLSYGIRVVRVVTLCRAR